VERSFYNLIQNVDLHGIVDFIQYFYQEYRNLLVNFYIFISMYEADLDFESKMNTKSDKETDKNNSKNTENTNTNNANNANNTNNTKIFSK
jgi:hypothetical protein